MKLFYISLHWDAQDKNNLGGAQNAESFFLCSLRLCTSDILLLNRDIAVQTNWTHQEINNQKNSLVDVAIKVFYP